MPPKKQYESVSELLRDVTGDNELVAELEQRIAEREVTKQLIVMRVRKGLSQKDIADKIGCSQSRISKLENGFDRGLRLGDLSGYCNALSINLKPFNFFSEKSAGR